MEECCPHLLLLECYTRKHTKLGKAPKSGINQIFLYFFLSFNGKRLAVNSNILKNSIHSVINFSTETYSHAKEEKKM